MVATVPTITDRPSKDVYSCAENDGKLFRFCPSVLEGYITKADLARQLNRSVRTLQGLAARRVAPPGTKMRQLIFYNAEHIRTIAAGTASALIPVAADSWVVGFVTLATRRAVKPSV
jgi:hypothetical protein